MSDGSGSILLKLLLLLALILINAFFSMSEIAIITVKEAKLRRLAEEGSKGAKKLLRLTDDFTSFLSTIQIGVTLAGFLTSAVAAENFSVMLASWASRTFHISSAAQGVTHAVSLVVITLIISYFSLVIGELVPKRIALQKAEPIALRVAGALTVVRTALHPLVAALTVSGNFLVRLLGFDPNADEQSPTEQEILMMVDAGEESGVIEESQKEMINNIFEFDDIPVQDIMTHRTNIAAVELHDPLADAIALGVEQGYSRIPVFDDDLDNIQGVLYVKDLLPYVGRDIPPDVQIAALMRPAHFVPESKRCGPLFQEMTEKRIHVVVVLDEYGGTAGIATIEDLLESIVGSIQDEYDDEEEEISRVNDTTFTVDGSADIEEVEEILDAELPGGDFDTLGGMIFSVLGRIPGEDEHPSLEVSGYRFTVLKVEDRRVERVMVERLEPGTDEGLGDRRQGSGDGERK